MTQQNTRPLFFTIALGMVGFLLCYSISLASLVERLGPVPAFSIGIVFALLILFLASISRLRGEPPRLRCLFLIILMVLYMINTIIGMYVVMTEQLVT